MPVEDLRRSTGAWRKPGLSWVEHSDTKHSFLVGDTGHPQTLEIHGKLYMRFWELLLQLKRVMQWAGCMINIGTLIAPDHFLLQELLCDHMSP